MTDEEVNNLSSSMAALTKQIEKNNAALLIGSKTIDDQSKDYEEILKSSQELEKSEKRQNGYLKEVRSNLKETLGSTIKIGGVLTSIGSAAFFGNVVKDIVELDNKMTALSVRMGKGTKGIAELKGSVHTLQREFGAAYESAVGIVEELAKDKYVGNITEAAAGVNLFSRASGVADTSVIELTNNLSKMGGLSTKSINAMYAEMIKVQQSVGISDKGMDALIGTINEMAFSMSAFGKSDEDIRKMTAETTALVGAMEKVGISASKSTELVQRLTDPDRIEDNILLYSQLGISIEDAMSGSIDGSKLDTQFKEMAERVTQMGPIAGSQFASSMGLSYKEVTRMAKMEAGDAKKIAEQAATPEEQALEVMKNLEKSTEGVGKQLETSLNKVEGKLKSMPMALLLGFALIVPLIVRQAKKLYHKIFDKKDIQASVDTAVVPSMVNGAKKAGKKIKGEVNKAENIIKGKVDKMFVGTDQKIDKLMQKANKEKFFDKWLDSSNINAFDNIKAQMVTLDGEKEKLLSGLQDIDPNIKVGKRGGLVGMKKAEKNAGDNKAKRKALEALQKQYDKLALSEKTLQMREEKQYKKMGPKVAAQYKMNKALAEEKKQNDLMSQSQDQLNKLNDERNKNELEIAKLMAESAKYDDAGKKAAAERIEMINKENEALETKIKDQKTINEQAAEAAGKAKTEANKQEKIAKKAPEKHTNFVTKAGAAVSNKVGTAYSKTTLGKNLAEAKTKAGTNKLGFGKRAGVIAKTTGKGLAKGAGKAGLKALKGIGKGLGGIMKTIGPMALVMAIVGKLVSKIQEPLSAMMDQIVDTMAPIMEAFMPAIEILMNVIAHDILPPILQIAAKILEVVHVILEHTLIPILRALGHLPGKIGDTFSGVADAIDSATGPGVTDALKSAADNLAEQKVSSEKIADNTEEVADNTEERDENEPVVINAEGGSLVANGYTEPVEKADEKTTSTTTTVTQEEDTSKKELDNAKKEKIENEKNDKLEEINNNSGALPKIERLLEELLEAITGNKVDINFKGPEISEANEVTLPT